MSRRTNQFYDELHQYYNTQCIIQSSCSKKKEKSSQKEERRNVLHRL